LSENQEDNVVYLSKSQLRRKAIMDGKPFDAYTDEISDEDFRIAIKALFGPNEVRGHKPE
jgi:hypothetical protein